MSIIVNVRGVDDFGKEPINAKFSRYSQHYPRPKLNDIMLYYIPKGIDGGVSVGIYQVTEETEHYSDHEGFQYCSGIMINLVGTGCPIAFLNKLFETHPKLAKSLDDKILELQQKYNPELFK